MAASVFASCKQAVLVCNMNRLKAKATTNVLLQFSKQYGRGMKRTAVAVRSPEEDRARLKSKGIAIKDPRRNPHVTFVPGDPTQAQFSKKFDGRRQPSGYRANDSFKHNIGKVNKNPKVVAKPAHQERTQTGVLYELLEEGDKRFGRVLLATKTRKEREKKGMILLEGRRLILDSLRAGAQLKYLYFSDTDAVSGLPADLLVGAQLYKAQYRHLKMWADTHTPAGMIGVFAKPDQGEVLLPQQDYLPLTLVCDNVRDPGNMGTIIRTAAAAGCKKIITTKGCVDVWDPKVLRSAMGAHFYTSVLSGLGWEQILNYLDPSAYLCIADARKSQAVESTFDVGHPKVIELLTSADTDSLQDSDTSDDDTDDEAERRSGHEGSRSRDDKAEWETSDAEDDGDQMDSGAREWSRGESEAFGRVPLSVIEYSDMDLSGADEAVVIVGGETEGVSAQARKLAFERYGRFVTIPMVESADSLNTAAATAIILYEARRQLQAAVKREQQSQSERRTSVV